MLHNPLDRYQNKLYQIFDQFGLGYSIIRGIKIEINLDALDDNELNSITNISGLFNNIVDKGDINDVKFILPIEIKNYLSESELNQIEKDNLLNNFVFEYLKETALIYEKSGLNLISGKTNLINLKSYKDIPLNQIKTYTNVWGYALSGILIFPKSVLNGDIFINRTNNYILNVIENLDGNLYIYDEINDMGVIKTITGDLVFSSNIMQNNLKSLSPLYRVDGNLVLRNTRVTLDTLIKVGGNLNLRNNLVTNLGKLKEVEGNLLISRYNYINLEQEFDNIIIKGKIKRYNDGFTLRFADDNWFDDLISKI